MPITIIGMLDEREESLRLLKNCIEARGHKTALTDISIGKGAIDPTLRDTETIDFQCSGHAVPCEGII